LPAGTLDGSESAASNQSSNRTEWRFHSYALHARIANLWFIYKAGETVDVKPRFCCSLKAKFRYAVWFEAGSKPVAN